MEPVPCARCGVFIRERSELLYTDDGEPMCAPCRKKADEPRKLRAVTDPILWRALGGAFWGVIGLPISVVFLAGRCSAACPRSPPGSSCSVIFAATKRCVSASVAGTDSSG